MNIHPEIERLAFLLGTWTGEGRGEYPTIEPFEYQETVTFEHFGKPFVAYSQRTKGPEGPLHTESGYFRPVADDRLELVMAQPTGVAEIHTGTQTGQRIELESRWVGLSPTAKRVDRVGRTIEVTDGTMRNELRMASVGQEYQWHLGAELTQTRE